jgi:hypothetical protein
MTTYRAIFRSDADQAEHDFEAETAEKALALARRYFDEGHADDLYFEPYSDALPVNEIAIYRDYEECAVWTKDDLRLRNVASDLLEAAEMVVARWERGDLAEAVRKLDAAIAKAKCGDA